MDENEFKNWFALMVMVTYRGPFYADQHNWLWLYERIHIGPGRSDIDKLEILDYYY